MSNRNVLTYLLSPFWWHMLKLSANEMHSDVFSAILSEKPRVIFGSGADPILLLILFLLWWPIQQKPKAPSFQLGLEWNFAGMFLE